MPKYKQHIRVPTALFEHSGYKGLADNRKPYALAIIVMLLKYVNQKKGECFPRYAKIRKDLGCSKKTLTNYMHLLSTAGLIRIRRLSSTNLYTINPILLVNEVNVVQGVGNMVHISGVPNAHINKTSLNNIYNNIGKNKLDNKIDRIVNSKEIDKQTKIVELASVPLAELKQSISKHPYYIRQAIEHQEQELRDARAVPKHVVEQAMTAAVSKTIKNRSASYKAKVEYNKRNNLDWQGKPKK
jgi:ribosomal protein S13